MPQALCLHSNKATSGNLRPRHYVHTPSQGKQPRDHANNVRLLSCGSQHTSSHPRRRDLWGRTKIVQMTVPVPQLPRNFSSVGILSSPSHHAQLLSSQVLVTTCRPRLCGSHGMRNIRIASLPINRSVASEDCQTCTRRRIRCDRSLPRCRKCTLRDISCPGYGPTLKWNQGIASRGKWRGKHAPFDHDFAIEGQLSEPEQKQCHRAPVFSPPKVAIQLSSKALSDCASTDMLSGVLKEHFRKEVSPRLTWLDSPDNPWRTLVAPLASTDTCVSTTVLYLAAAHLASRSSPALADHDTLFHLHHELRPRALKALTSGLRLAVSNEGVTGMTSAGLLAGTLVFCHAEMLKPNSDEWKIHLRACQALMNKSTANADHALSKSTIQHFLAMEIEYLEAFDDLSTFSKSPNSRQERSLQKEDVYQRSLLWSFTSVLRDITEHERSAYATKPVVCSSELDYQTWQDRLRGAYEAVFVDVRRQQPQPAIQGLEAVFSAVVRAHYYAGMIYLEQAIPFAHDQLSHRLFLVQNLAEVIDFARNAAIFDHDLFWPLFILGTEYSNSSPRQAQLTAQITECMWTTGFWCNKAALDFLKTYWARPAAEEQLSWIEYARQHNHMLTPFLIF